MTEENLCSVSKRHVITRSVSYDNELPVRKYPVRRLTRNLSYSRLEQVIFIAIVFVCIESSRQAHWLLVNLLVACVVRCCLVHH